MLPPDRFILTGYEIQETANADMASWYDYDNSPLPTSVPTGYDLTMTIKISLSPTQYEAYTEFRKGMNYLTPIKIELTHKKGDQ